MTKAAGILPAAFAFMANLYFSKLTISDDTSGK